MRLRLSSLSHFFSRRKLLYGVPVIVILLALISFGVWMSPPSGFPEGSTITIPSGMSVRGTGELLEEARVIGSADLFIAFVTLFGGGGVQSGDYLFDRPLALYEVVVRVSEGRYGMLTKRLVVPEGTNARELGSIVEKTFPHLDARIMEAKAREYEGYLFPDTYAFFSNVGYDDIITAMRFRFEEQVETLGSLIEASGEPLSRIVVMASLLEREARQYETMRTIAGILWKRIDEGMPLQVDAVFGYIFNRPTYSPSFDDLEVDHPYNTYRNKDLPPGPIGNPGINALKAAANPTPSPYYFYLTGRDGEMYYARTFDEHKKNRALYLD